MFLSIIIPVYNAENYLAQCLDSCLSQDISRGEYEVICVNDGSSDGSGKVLEEYAKTYSNVHVINQQNAGVSAARNTGLDAAPGDYIWFVDSDDLILPNCLGELQHICMEKNCDELTFRCHYFSGFLSLEELDAKRDIWEANEKFSSVCFRLYRRKVIDRQRFFENLTIAEDQAFVRAFY